MEYTTRIKPNHSYKLGSLTKKANNEGKPVTCGEVYSRHSDGSPKSYICSNGIDEIYIVEDSSLEDIN